ncbi:mutt/nudix hydrolase [Aspergillus nomiae NRRL 13137]|uniref:Mutt/nudix hydrolase n=1 Tax=Aspergillus nomiae NRRL (strain ATCC 15546 / NRRL 13137 / CBS 260.88 / M93) TaxID=1509407 RepID=A0A0L1IS10_ASPN3|nr:mutt/nudix hydrolase [Aspergillus nomiae NRRL 13137]KNG82170.1 mutt/nudix hydrolase [Aspergillus nomiae NRRL 13137]
MSTINNLPVVRTGVNVFVFNDKGQFVLGRRMGSHGENTWGLPGGSMEFGEDFEECTGREVREETALEFSDLEFLTVTNDFFPEANKHYTTNFFAAKLEGDQKEPVLMEKDKCLGWKWFTWEEIEEHYKAPDAVKKDEKNKFEGQELFLPMLSLFRQRAGLHPLKAYEARLGETNKKPVIGLTSK